MSTLKWILIGKLCELSGYSDDAIRAKIKRGIWKEGRHWRKAADNRIVFNIIAINNWLGGSNA